MSNLLRKILGAYLQDPEDGNGNQNGGDGIERTADGDVVGTGNAARLALLSQINDRNDAALAADGALEDVNDDGTTTQFVVPDLTQEEEAERVSALQSAGDEDGTTAAELARAEAEANGEDGTAAAEAARAEASRPRMIKLKVNGKELELTEEEVVNRAQKVEAADQYLVEAARIKREAEDARATARTESQPHSLQPSKEDEAAAVLEKRRALVRAIQIGTEEEAMSAIEELQRSGQERQLDAGALARTIDERVVFNQAVGKFESEYKDIMGDPVLRKLALQRDAELVKGGDKRDYYARFKATGDELRAWRDSLKTAAPEPKSEDKGGPSKLERKSAATPAPRPAQAKAKVKTAEDEDQEESVSTTIANMAKHRGGPQWLRS